MNKNIVRTPMYEYVRGVIFWHQSVELLDSVRAYTLHGMCTYYVPEKRTWLTVRNLCDVSCAEVVIGWFNRLHSAHTYYSTFNGLFLLPEESIKRTASISFRTRPNNLPWYLFGTKSQSLRILWCILSFRIRLPWSCTSWCHSLQGWNRNQIVQQVLYAET